MDNVHFGEVGCGSAEIGDVKKKVVVVMEANLCFSAVLGRDKWQNTWGSRWPGRFVRADKELVGHSNRFEKV